MHVSLCISRQNSKHNKKKDISEYFKKSKGKERNEESSFSVASHDQENPIEVASHDEDIVIPSNYSYRSCLSFSKHIISKRKVNNQTDDVINVKYSIRHTRFEKDCFKGKWSSTYFLSHFHSDHTEGLSKSFKKGVIFATKTTCNLASQKYNLPQTLFHVVDIGKTYFFTNCNDVHLQEIKACIRQWCPFQDFSSQGFIQTKDASDIPDEERIVRVDVVDANHCPGACLFLFTMYRWIDHTPSLFFTTLYTGDFRYNPEIVQNSVLHEYLNPSSKKLDLIYIDNTYVSKALSFPSQDTVIHTILTTLDLYWGKSLCSKPYKIGVFVGSYTIGKEKVWLAIAKHYNLKVYLPEDRMNRIRCYEDYEEQYKPYVTSSADDTPLRVIPMIQSGYSLEKLNLHQQYERVIVIVPTGWEQGKMKSQLNEQDPSLCKYTFNRHKNMIIQGYPYSEHCSFNELKAFLDSLHYSELVCIVDSENNSQLLNKLKRKKVDIRESFHIT